MARRLWFADCSGSVRGCPSYFAVLEAVLRRDLRPGDELYRWDNDVTSMTEDEAWSWIKKRRGFGGTTPVVVADAVRAANFHGEIILFTDGAIGHHELERCDQALHEAPTAHYCRIMGSPSIRARACIRRTIVQPRAVG
jgi:hypothetical protein